ncbi:MAG: ATP-binding cassette domain-containing protein [Bacteroidetes bacterium]|nr:ATP-binding cassette domain-containing protein [Bacteroidota bacterium]
MNSKSPLRRLAELIYLDKGEVFSIYFYAILSGLVDLSLPVGVQAIIGFVMGATMVTSIYVLIFFVVLGVLSVGLMRINQMRIIEKIEQKIFTRYAFSFSEKIPNLDLRELDKYYLPEKVNRFFDTINVQKGLSKLLLEIPSATIQILFGLVLLSLYHPIFIVFGIVLVTILYTILMLTSGRGLTSSLEESHYKYKVVAWLEEMAKVIKSFKYSQGTHFNLKKTDKNVIKYIEARTSHFKVLLFQYKTLIFFKVAITATMLVVGTTLLLNQELNIGEFIAAEIVILSVIKAVEKLIINLDKAYDVLTGIEKLSTITESPSELDGNTDFITKDGIDISMYNVSFSYQNDAPIFKQFNAHIPPFSLVCVSGDESSGKSTFIKLLSGNYRVFDGNILYNQIPIQNYRLESLRSQTGIYLNQQEVFEGTVLENINLGREHITPQHIMSIALELGIHDFIQPLQNGFDTIIDTAGKKLSTSLLKKILLLRAFVNQPALLLLEEPWNGLESKVKPLIINYLKNLSTRASVIVVSNDTEFAKQCTININLGKGETNFKGQ